MKQNTRFNKNKHRQWKNIRKNTIYMYYKNNVNLHKTYNSGRRLGKDVIGQSSSEFKKNSISSLKTKHIFSKYCLYF